MADYRIAVGPQQGHKAFTLQILPDCRADKPRVNLTHFHDVFALNSKHRVQVMSAKQ
jgi:hypothetical protein